MWRALLIVLSLPWLIDAGIRLLLARSARSEPPEEDGTPATELRWLVVVPARSEGRAVLPTLASVIEAAHGLRVRIVLLLDGGDEEAEQAAKELAVPTVVKEPAGPSKGAVLRYLVESRAELLDEVDAVLVLDVGSRLSPGFFAGLVWPRVTDAVQARLRGEGAGVGRAASLSEALAQQWQDRGRQALGWAVQLRGTGTAYTPAAFSALAPRLRTSIEDTEATLLLAAGGGRSVLGGEDAWVEDVKPENVAEAARQRSRWFAGQLAVLFRHPGALFQLTGRNPFEGVAFTTGLLSRPLSLTAAMRFLLATILAIDGFGGRGGLPSVATSCILSLSLVSDLLILRRATDASWAQLAIGGARILLAWVGAVLMLPRALLGWARARRD